MAEVHSTSYFASGWARRRVSSMRVAWVPMASLSSLELSDVYLSIPAIALEEPGLTLVTQTDVEDFPQPLFGAACGHRRHHFHTPGEIAEHPVR